MRAISEEGSLKHYGIIGMKWGQHKARQAGKSYSYKSHTTNKYNKKASTAKESAKEWDEIAKNQEAKGKTKAAAKSRALAAKDRADAKRFDSRAKLSAKLDKSEQAFADKVTTGGAIAANLLLPGASSAAKSYSRLTGMGQSRTKAVIKTVIGGQLWSSIEKAIYIRKNG